MQTLPLQTPTCRLQASGSFRQVGEPLKGTSGGREDSFMADYREISQEYARQAINAAFILNGGAAVALLSQVSGLLEKGLSGGVRQALMIWALGTVLAALTWVFGFISTRYVDKSEREPGLEKQHLRTSDRWMLAGLIAVLVSIAVFALGCYRMADSF